MKNIWAPWRIEYIKGPKFSSCVFCDALEQDDPLILKKGEACFAIMNRFPYTAGHCMVVPDRHVGDLSELSPGEMTAIMELTRDVMTAIRATMHPDGFNVGCNIGKVAGAGIADHFHLHVVPRWSGDINFMPVLDDVHVIPELVRQTRDKIAGNLP
ncbi:MAG TPA: HIT domain-containing protein [Deltaproteobacteria bacterium]|jgi:ATP adenylyltransferase|nr:HIT domain-containing protein [Deltaproteobacteria bacterium]HOI07611.1 HIT domain-containing protein [Deltaproteobacteria bacterium]